MVLLAGALIGMGGTVGLAGADTGTPLAVKPLVANVSCRSWLPDTLQSGMRPLVCSYSGNKLVSAVAISNGTVNVGRGALDMRSERQGAGA